VASASATWNSTVIINEKEESFQQIPQSTSFSVCMKWWQQWPNSSKVDSYENARKSNTKSTWPYCSAVAIIHESLQI